MKSLTFLAFSLLLVFFISCGAPQPESNYLKDPSLYEQMESMELDKREEFMKSEQLDDYTTRMLDRPEYNGPFRALIDSTLDFAGIPKGNIRFYSTDDKVFEAIYNSVTGVRSVYVNATYMISVRDKTSREALTFVLFHEIGHQLYGHSLRPWEKGLMKRSDAELQADQYAGYQSALKGIPFEECLRALKFFENKKSDNGEYPPIDRRIKAAEIGFLSGKNRIAKMNP